MIIKILFYMCICIAVIIDLLFSDALPYYFLITILIYFLFQKISVYFR